MLGSLGGDDRASWDVGLRAYREVRSLSNEEAEVQISSDILASFRSLADRFPAEHYQNVVRERSREGEEAGTIYLDVCRDMMELATREIRSLVRRG